MIGISKLYCGQVEPSDALRYGRHSSQLPSHLLQFSEDKKPVVVWNMTRRCNLKCVHCYAQAVDPDGKDEISTEQGKAIISDLAAYGAPVMLFSGGEPLVRQDLPELASYATEKGMRAVISTNGTLITKEKARELKAINLSYVGISLDGAEEIHDKFRGVPNSFKKALEGLENCKAEGLKVGLRFTINKRNVVEIPKVFKLLRELEVPRICFYHLVYSGRGSEMIKEDLNHAETRSVVDLIMDETRALFDAGMPKEVLTVDNHADGPYVWMRMLKEDPKRAEEVLQRGQQSRPRHRLYLVGRQSPCRPVLAQPYLRQRARTPVLRNLGRSEHRTAPQDEEQEGLCEGTLRLLPLPEHLRRQLPLPCRSLLRRRMGPGSRLLPDRRRNPPP